MDPSPHTWVSPSCTAVTYMMVDIYVFTYMIKGCSQIGCCNSTFNPIKEGMQDCAVGGAHDNLCLRNTQIEKAQKFFSLFVLIKYSIFGSIVKVFWPKIFKFWSKIFENTLFLIFFFRASVFGTSLGSLVCISHLASRVPTINRKLWEHLTVPTSRLLGCRRWVTAILVTNSSPCSFCKTNKTSKRQGKFSGYSVVGGLPIKLSKMKTWWLRILVKLRTHNSRVV